jgi:hypothetical protein
MDDLIFMLDEKTVLLDEKDARIAQLSRTISHLTAKCEQLRVANMALVSAKSSKSCAADTSPTLPEPLDLS